MAILKYFMEKKMDTEIKKILDLIIKKKELLGWSDTKLSQVAFGHSSAIKGIKRGGSITYRSLAKLAKALDFEVYIGEKRRYISSVPKKIKGKDYVLIPKLNISAAAGAGAINEEQQNINTFLSFDKKWLKDKGLQENHASIIDVKGDSMNPTLKNKQIVLINNLLTEIKNGEIYVLTHDNNLIIKRLHKINKSYIALSDNYLYSPIKLNETTIIHGKCVWVGGNIE